MQPVASLRGCDSHCIRGDSTSSISEHAATHIALEKSQTVASLSGSNQHWIGGESTSSITEWQRQTLHWRKVNQQYLLVVVTNTAIRKVARTNTASQEGQPGAIMRAATDNTTGECNQDIT